jgi:hypothetical protein
MRSYSLTSALAHGVMGREARDVIAPTGAPLTRKLAKPTEFGASSRSRRADRQFITDHEVC